MCISVCTPEGKHVDNQDKSFFFAHQCLFFSTLFRKDKARGRGVEQCRCSCCSQRTLPTRIAELKHVVGLTKVPTKTLPPTKAATQTRVHTDTHTHTQYEHKHYTHTHNMNTNTVCVGWGVGKTNDRWQRGWLTN